MRLSNALLFRGLLLAVAMAATITACAQDAATHSGDTAVFASVVGTLHEKTKVPLRLPTFLPFDRDRSNPLYANLRSVDENSYSVELGWVADCEGGNACHYGTVSGSTKPVEVEQGRRVAVNLVHGIHGYFVDSTCGAHCDDATLNWSQNGYFYQISVKAGRMAELKLIANSAIGGDR